MFTPKRSVCPVPAPLWRVLALLLLLMPAGLQAQLPPFRQVHYVGTQTLLLTPGDADAVTVEGPRQLQQLLLMRVDSAGVLHISEKPGAAFKQPVQIAIAYSYLEAVTLGGQARLLNDVSLRQPLRLHLTGQSEANLQLEAPAGSIDARLQDRALLKLGGTADTLRVAIKGDALLRATDLAASHAELSHAGSQDALLHATGFLKIVLTGSGTVVYGGTPHLQQEVTGTGHVRRQ
jgi:hypothetical protein